MSSRGYFSVALLLGTIAAGSLPARGEVYAQIDARGGFVAIHTVVARGSEGRVWDSQGAAVRAGHALNPEGDYRGDGRPDFAVNPLTGLPRAVWAMKDGSDFDIVTSEFDGFSWSSPVKLRAAEELQDLDPRIVYRRDGVAVVTWWQKSAAPQVRMAFATPDGIWHDGGVISAAGVRAKKPSIRQDGMLTIVAYQTPRDIGIVSFQAAVMNAEFGDGPTPFPRDTGGGSDPAPPDLDR